MTLEDEIEKILSEFGIKYASDLNEEFNKALKKGGRKSPQEAALNFTPELKLDANAITIQVFASGKYWRYVERGRKKGSQPPSKVFNKKWFNTNNIDPRKAIFQLTVDYNKKKGFKNRKVKLLPFDKAVTRLGYLKARAIKKYGIKPKPFKDKVEQDGRLEDLQKSLSALVGKNIILNFNT